MAQIKIDTNGNVVAVFLVNQTDATDLIEVADDDHRVVSFQIDRDGDIVRQDRNAKLTACDWTVLSDAPLTTTEKAAWKAYRQALRDVTSQAAFPQSVDWPVTP